MTEQWKQKSFEVDPESGGIEYGEIPVGISEEGLMAGFHGLREIVSARPVWQDRPRGRMLYLDLRNPDPWAVKFNGVTWKKEEIVAPDKLGNLSRLPGAVLVTNPVNCQTGEGLDCLKSGLDLVTPGLQKHSSVVMAVETKREDGVRDLETRVEVLKEYGLVVPQVLRRRGRRRMVWQGRLKKKREGMLVDVVASSKEKGNYLRQMAIKVKNQYLENGYEVLDWGEIFGQLKASKSPIFDIERLKSGMGVVLQKTDCGCTFEYSLYGEANNLHKCGDALCGFTEVGFEAGTVEGDEEAEQELLGGIIGYEAIDVTKPARDFELARVGMTREEYAASMKKMKRIKDEVLKKKK